jgi:hypothetical protein
MMADHEWTEQDVRINCTEGVRPPPWVDEAFDEEEGESLREAFFDQLEILGPALDNSVTLKQVELLLAAFSMGASYGWDRAMTHGPMAQRPANAEAVAARRKAKAETRQKVREAWEQATKAGEDVSIEAIAHRCGVSRATAYRALHDD